MNSCFCCVGYAKICKMKELDDVLDYTLGKATIDLLCDVILNRYSHIEVYISSFHFRITRIHMSQSNSVEQMHKKEPLSYVEGCLHPAPTST